MDTLSASVLRDRKPQIGIVLGSGLGALADRIEGAEALSYSDIPGFPVILGVGTQRTICLWHHWRQRSSAHGRPGAPV